MAFHYDIKSIEWKTSIHANAWNDTYFQVDFQFDGSQQICLNCHTPLENQQENLVLGFIGGDKFDPILPKRKNNLPPEHYSLATVYHRLMGYSFEV